MILNRILDAKRERLERAVRVVPLSELKARALGVPPPVPFRAALKKPEGNLALIAELKKASPSKGVIRSDFDPVPFARTYEAHGASAISVLTEEDFFQGSLDVLRQVRQTVRLPLLRKDFIIDPYQIYEARVHGADAILLIATVLERSRIEDFSGLASELGLDALVEVHSGSELDRVLSLGCRLVGINNRNLNTLQIRLEHTLELLPEIPPDCTVVTESGIDSRRDVERFIPTAVSAMLVGTAIMKSPDLGAKIDELLGRSQDSLSVTVPD